MSYKTNDLLYCAMLAFATTQTDSETNEHFCYITKQTMLKNKQIFLAAANVRRTEDMWKQIDKMIQQNLVEKFDLIIHNQSVYQCFKFQKNYKTYKIFSADWLKYLLNTRSRNAVRIYLYLYNKFTWKENYEFTIKELLLAMGYSISTATNGNIIGMANDVLDSLYREQIINYNYFYDLKTLPNGKEVPSPKMRLLFVADSIEQLPQTPRGIKTKNKS